MTGTTFLVLAALALLLTGLIAALALRPEPRRVRVKTDRHTERR